MFCIYVYVHKEMWFELLRILHDMSEKKRKNIFHWKLFLRSFCSFNKNKRVHTTSNNYLVQTKLKSIYMSVCLKNQIVIAKKKKVTLSIKQMGNGPSTRHKWEEKQEVYLYLNLKEFYRRFSERKRKTVVHTKLLFGSFFSFNKNKSVHTTPNIYVAQTKLENSYMSGGCQRSQIMLEK